MTQQEVDIGVDLAFLGAEIGALSEEERKSACFSGGYACGKNGPNAVNCHFALFATPAMTESWVEGRRKAESEKPDRVENGLAR